MVRIRLRRVGAKKQPSYRVVIANQRSPRDGRFIEIIGSYNPLTDPATIDINADRAVHWLNAGAQPSDSVQQLFRRHGIVDMDGNIIYEPESEVAAEAESATADTEETTATDEAPAEPEETAESAEDEGAETAGVSA